MAKLTNKAVKKKSSKKLAVKKVPTKKSSTKTKEKFYNYWGLVTINRTEAYIHVAFDSTISGKNLKKWNEGYLASLLKAKALVLNASIVTDWKIEKVAFEREDPSFREQDYPFWVGKNEPDQIYAEIIKLNT